MPNSVEKEANNTSVVLAIEASSKLASISLQNKYGKIFTKVCREQKSHAEFFNPALDELLKETSHTLQDIVAIVTTRGPGSFTGIRVGSVMTTTLSMLLKIPIHAYDSLFCLAFGAHQMLAAPKVVSLINAYKGMVFFGAYDFGLLPACEAIKPSLCSLNEIHKNLNPLFEFIKNRDSRGPNAKILENPEGFLIIGDALLAYENFFSQIKEPLLHLAPGDPKLLSDHLLYPYSETLVSLFNRAELRSKPLDWKSFEPLYLKASEAEINLKKF